MDWRKRLWIIIMLCCAVPAVGCASQQNQVDSADRVVDPLANNLEGTSTAETEPLPIEAAADEVEASATAVQTVAPTIMVGPTTQQSTGKVTATAVQTVEPTVTTEPTATQQGTGEANADVLFVLARQESENTWRFIVTVEHPDTGWEDYADGWDVVLPDGSVARQDPDSPFTRLLLHPHETEQPFTRSQSGIVIAPGVNEVTVRAHDLVDGFGGREVALDLTLDSGQDYEVQRLQK